MNVNFAVTIAGPETKGLMKILAAKTHEHDARWLNSRTIHLEGRVACLLKVAVPESRLNDLQQSFADLQGFYVDCYSLENQPAKKHQSVIVHMSANDRPGLVSDISHILENLDIKLDHIESHRMGVAGLGRNVFKADMKLQVPEEADLDQLTASLEDLSDNTLVEIS